MTTTGTLYGIGVGPGDPDLLPFKAVKVLKEVDVVFTASSTKNSYSKAVNIAAAHIPKRTRIVSLAFPMNQDTVERENAWRTHAETIAKEIKRGVSAAFLTLGDPLTYSTYGYLLRYLKSDFPEIHLVTIPGITSYQAAAAAINTPLVEGEESLLITSGANGGKQFYHSKTPPENVVFLKAYRYVKEITETLEEAGMIKGSVGISNCCCPEQEIIHDIDKLKTRKPNYWTLIISKRTP